MERTELEQAQADLAFALAQGDGYAEDAAAARVAALTACPCGAVGPCANPNCHVRTRRLPGGGTW